jgi:hypothetical protein
VRSVDGVGNRGEMCWLLIVHDAPSA